MIRDLRPSAWLAAVFVSTFMASLKAEIGVTHDAVKPVSRLDEAWWHQRHESICQRVKQGIAELVFIGDSITQGWEGNGRTVWKKHYAHRTAVNLGIGGDRTQHVLWRLANGNLEGLSPKLAVIMIGTSAVGSIVRWGVATNSGGDLDFLVRFQFGPLRHDGDWCRIARWPVPDSDRQRFSKRYVSGMARLHAQ